MWPQVLTAVIGIWLMAAPTVLGYARPMSTSDHIAGPLVATFACIAIWECTRALRWINLPLGIWVVVGTFVLGAPTAAFLNGILCGMAIACLATQGGTIQQQFGGGWSMLWRQADTNRTS